MGLLAGVVRKNRHHHGGKKKKPRGASAALKNCKKSNTGTESKTALQPRPSGEPTRPIYKRDNGTWGMVKYHKRRRNSQGIYEVTLSRKPFVCNMPEKGNRKGREANARPLRGQGGRGPNLRTQLGMLRITLRPRHNKNKTHLVARKIREKKIPREKGAGRKTDSSLVGEMKTPKTGGEVNTLTWKKRMKS